MDYIARLFIEHLNLHCSGERLASAAFSENGIYVQYIQRRKSSILLVSDSGELIYFSAEQKLLQNNRNLDELIWHNIQIKPKSSPHRKK